MANNHWFKIFFDNIFIIFSSKQKSMFFYKTVKNPNHNLALNALHKYLCFLDFC